MAPQRLQYSKEIRVRVRSKRAQTEMLRHVTKADRRDERWRHWSRQYEYPLILDKIAKLRPESVHNTACGYGNEGRLQHLEFCEELAKLCLTTFFSDKEPPPEERGPAFFQHDLLDEWDGP